MAELETLIERDGAVCVWCGHEPWHSDLTVEHLLPRSRGGSDSAANLAVACRRCNHARRSQAVIAYVRRRQAAGAAPQIEQLALALERLSVEGRRRSEREYGRSQLRSLLRI